LCETGVVSNGPSFLDSDVAPGGHASKNATYWRNCDDLGLEERERRRAEKRGHLRGADVSSRGRWRLLSAEYATSKRP
jgi:hypothetical protein